MRDRPYEIRIREIRQNGTEITQRFSYSIDTAIAYSLRCHFSEAMLRDAILSTIKTLSRRLADDPIPDGLIKPFRKLVQAAAEASAAFDVARMVDESRPDDGLLSFDLATEGRGKK